MINGMLPESVVRKLAVAQISVSRMKVVVGMGCTDLLVPARLQLCAYQPAGLLVPDREAKAAQRFPPRQSQV